MATTAIYDRLKSLVVSMDAKLPPPNWSPTASSSSPSSPSDCSEIREEVEKLCRRMERIRAILSDAQEMEVRENSIKLWLDELREVAYDGEDAAEELEYVFSRPHPAREDEENEQETREEMRTRRRGQVSDTEMSRLQEKIWLDYQRVMGYRAEDGGKESPRRTPGGRRTPTRNPSGDMQRERQKEAFQKQILGKIKKINDRFEEIYMNRPAALWSKTDKQRQRKEEATQRLSTSSLLGNSRVYGRSCDKDVVVDMLLSSQGSEHGAEGVSVVSVVGMGGIGKTTLAQLVYHDDMVRNHFEVRSWVCVSDNFDVIGLTREILEAVTGETTNLRGFSALQEKLHEDLKERRFLLVLDDLWNENREQWESIWKSLSGGAEGSKVLVTTRNEKVSKISHAIRTHYLEGLPNRDCWSLFTQCAFGCRNPDDHPNLMSIGKQIVQKCGGVPLAIRTLGSLLYKETDEDKWYAILNSDIWELPEKENYILPALLLSYHHLPTTIKPCFAVCAVFPKDHLIQKEELILFWMAQGYIPNERKSMEDTGQEYFDDLLQRSFFQKFHDNFKMHDLIHDLALFVLGEEYFSIKNSRLSNTSRTVRHLSFEHGASITELLSCTSTCRFQYLRTFGLIDFHLSLPPITLDDMLKRMKCLRVLYLPNVVISSLPDSVGDLKHLRYLSVRVDLLPESLGNLLNLQTLQVSGISELPKCLKHLVNLRHLDLKECHPPMMPCGIGRLIELRTLKRFVVGKESCAAGIEELRDLKHLRGELTIYVDCFSGWVCREPILINKKDLKILHLEFRAHGVHMQQQLEEEVLELIQPHPNILELHILGYIGSRFPKWMRDPSSSSRLETLALHDCKNCKHLLAFGWLPRLRSLEVINMDTVEMDCELLGEEMVARRTSFFPSLELLSFKNLPEWGGLLSIGIEKGGAFPRLRRLSVVSCCKLKYVKLRHLTALRELNIKRCEELTMLDYYQHTHIPYVHTMQLEYCSKLNFSPVSQQQLPMSLRRLTLIGSPLLEESVRRQSDKLVGITWLLGHIYAWPHHRSLYNVQDVEEAVAARLPSYIEKLELRWDLEKHELSSSPKQAEQVLEVLRPPENSPLQELVIEGYHGWNFPDWVGHPYYLHNLVKMSLSSCFHCECLPALGHLPSLRGLHISNMCKVGHVGREFWAKEGEQIGDGTFLSLQVLTIRNCPELRTFTLPAFPDFLCGGRMASSDLSSSSSNTLSLDPFPCLKLLLIEDCPKLGSFIGMHRISSLKILFLRRCPAFDFPQEVQLPLQLQYANIRCCPLLSEWCQGDRISHLHKLWVDGKLVISDGASRTDSFNAMIKIMGNDLLLLRF